MVKHTEANIGNNTMFDEIRDHILNVNLNTRLHDEYETLRDEESFRKIILKDYDNIIKLKDKERDKKVLIMGHGPSLLNIDKSKYKNHKKMTCNSFHKIDNFFDEQFKVDYWCAANSLEAVSEPLKVCQENEIVSFLTIPKKTELEHVLNTKGENTFCWLWEHRILQKILAKDANLTKLYTHCNTITNHMIAFSIWLGFKEISITGFDLSHSKALEKHGHTHAGFTEEYLLTSNKEAERNPLDDPRERKQIIQDLKYLCYVARSKGIKIVNLSHEENELPPTLS